MSVRKCPSQAFINRLLTIVILLYACISLLWLDAALSGMLESFLFHQRIRAFWRPLLLTSIATTAQWFLSRFREGHFQWLLPAAGLTGTVLSDILWLSSGDYGDNILAWILLSIAGPLCAGCAAAALLSWLHGQSKASRYITVSILLAVLFGCLWSWPRSLTNRIDIHFDGKAVFYNETSMAAEVQLPEDEFAELLHRAKIYPAFREQPWHGEWAMAVRLNEQYILMAPRDGTPCIYEYTGDMAAFDLTRPKWAVYSYTLHYDGLMLYSTGWSANAQSIVGTWETSGTISILGENAPDPAEITEIWTLNEDGTATVEVITPETMLPAAEFTYALENGILTLTANGRSTEYTCTFDAETMTWNDSLVFTKIE